MKRPEFPGFAVLTRLSQEPGAPVIINIKREPTDDISGLADVLIGALGLTGVLLLGTAIAGLAVGALVFWLRSRSGAGSE